MLTRVQISNINAIDYCDVNFQKGKYKYLDNMIYHDKLVNPVAFYGSNGSGKSSFMKAVLHVLRLMLSEPQKASPFVVNKFNATKQLQKLSESVNRLPTEDEMRYTLDSVASSVKLFFEINTHEYEYYIETLMKGCIAKEYLTVDGETVFIRNIDSYQYNQKETRIVESLYPTVRRLSVDNQDDE